MVQVKRKSVWNRLGKRKQRKSRTFTSDMTKTQKICGATNLVKVGDKETASVKYVCSNKYCVICRK